MACGRHGRCCVPPEEADAGAEAGAGRLQPYVIRGGQRVRCRCGKRDGLQDDIPPPRKKEDVLRAPPNDIQKTLSTCPNPARLPVESPPLLPIEDPHLPAVGGPPLLPDVCPLCRSQTYNLPNLLSLPVVREPGLEVPPGVEPSGDVLGQLPAAGPGLGVFCPWRQAPPQAGAGCLCQCGRSLDDAGREVQGHARRLQCCGESAAKIAERIEKSLQTATALDAKSNAKEHLRRSLSRGEGAARESAKRSASVPQQMNLTRDGCLKMIQESKQTRATHDTPVYATTIQNIQTPWPVIKQHSTSLHKETHGEGSLNRSSHALQTQNSLERSQGRHCRDTPACTGAGDKSTSPGPQYKYNWWCVPQPFARFALQHNAKGDPRRIETEPETPRPVYSVVCPHHPHWHSTPVTTDDSNDMETEDRKTSISPSSNQDVYSESAKPLTETNNCTSVNLQESSRNEEEISNVSKGRGKLETTKKSSCCQQREIATQTLVSCVKMPLSSECNGKTIFASRETLYRKVDDSLQPINRPKTDSGTQTILTIARITPNSGLGISRTASKGTVCGSFVRTIGPSNSVKSMSGLQSICPIVHALSGDICLNPSSEMARK
ncbi:Protein of unknown function [Gryllus bimaculatus]|nr:Protein of unknown function [Gryllus bimaculatus]